MDIITGKTSEPIPIPSVTLKEASQMFTKLYNKNVDEIKALDGYEAKNFYIKVLNPSESGIRVEEFVLKILPMYIPYMEELVDINIACMLYLRDCGLVCPMPVRTGEGEYSTIQKLNCCYGNKVSSENNNLKEGPKQANFIVHALTYIAGEILHYAVPKSIPAEWYRVLGEYLAKVDKALLKYPHKEHIPSLTKFSKVSIWSLNTIPQYRALLHVVADSRRRQLLESIINQFEEKVVPKMARLRKAVLYNDYNDNNIVVKTTQPNSKNGASVDGNGGNLTDSKCKLDIVGIIDFGDICHTCLLFEVGIGLAYFCMMDMRQQGSRNPIETGRHFLRGYSSVMDLTDDEWDLLPVCVKARCAQSILAGLYSHSREPTNDYLLLDNNYSWDVVEFFADKSTQDIVAKWKEG